MDPFLLVTLAVSHTISFNASAAHLTQVFLSFDREKDLVPRDENSGTVCFMQRFGPNVVVDSLLESMKDILFPIADTIHLANGLIINSFREIEEKTLNELSQHLSMANVELYCVGPFLPEESGSSKNLATQIEVERWLSRKDKHDVVYVAHGSIAVPAPEQVYEIGMGLLSLEKPFIWSLLGVRRSATRPRPGIGLTVGRQ